jgi:hypothetical protein
VPVRGASDLQTTSFGSSPVTIGCGVATVEGPAIVLVGAGTTAVFWAKTATLEPIKVPALINVSVRIRNLVSPAMWPEY